MMTAPLIVGVPSAAHREALLRETAGGGRVPMAHAWVCPEHGPYYTAWCRGCDATHKRAGVDALWNTVIASTMEAPNALILSHPSDPEAGAMGLARLAWVATPDAQSDRRPLVWSVVRSRIRPTPGVVFSSVRLIPAHAELAWVAEPVPGFSEAVHVPALRDATCAAEAIGLVCVHLGLLDRVELVEVPRG